MRATTHRAVASGRRVVSKWWDIFWASMAERSEILARAWLAVCVMADARMS